MILHQASAGFAHRGAAGSTSLGEIGLGEKLAGRQLGRDQPVTQDAVNTLDFAQLVSLGSGWFRQYRVTMYFQRILPVETPGWSGTLPPLVYVIMLSSYL